MENSAHYRGREDKSPTGILFVDDTHFPLIDEPTNHLDISGRKQVAAYLKRKTRLHRGQP